MILTVNGDSVEEVFTTACLTYLRGIEKGKFVAYEDRGLRLRKTDSPTSPDFQKPMLEQSLLLEISNPRNRLVFSKEIDIFNLAGLWMYMLRGSNKVEDIEFYNPIARKFLDASSYHGRLRANWGEIIFAPRKDNLSAIEKVIHQLQFFPNSRRAYLPVFSYWDIGVESANLPCLAGMQFIINNGKLDCYTTMRSQAVVGVMPYDLFLLTMLQEWVAVHLGIPLGTYTHFAPVAGIREHDIPFIEKLGDTNIFPDAIEMEAMTQYNIQVVLRAEENIRTGNDPFDLLTSYYWNSFLWITQTRREFLNGQDRYISTVQSASGAFPASFIVNCINRMQKEYNSIPKVEAT